ncbi:TetR/AcrR family transcriptional regulator [Crossiella sp. NPDC003009]
MSEASGAGGRLTAKGRATRERIVAAAAQLMFERGVAGTSTEDVRAAAEVSTSQIYHYFRDKPALVRAVITHQTEQIMTAQQAFFARLDSMDGLRAWRDALVELQRSRQCAGGCPIGSLGSELADSDTAARVEVAAGFARWAEAIAAGLRAMRDRGELRAGADPDRLGLAVLTALQGGLLLTQIRRDTVALESGLDAMLELVESYLV